MTEAETWNAAIEAAARACKALKVKASHGIDDIRAQNEAFDIAAFEVLALKRPSPPKPASKPWFSTNYEAICWMRDEARQWCEDNPEVAAHLFEAATMFERTGGD